MLSQSSVASLNMFDGTNIIAGLEIGTTKICVVIGELKADGSLNMRPFTSNVMARFSWTPRA